MRTYQELTEQQQRIARGIARDEIVESVLLAFPGLLPVGIPTEIEAKLDALRESQPWREVNREDVYKLAPDLFDTLAAERAARRIYIEPGEEVYKPISEFWLA